MPTLFLASSSPRRAELLRQIGVTFQICRVDVDESWNPAETLEQYVSRLSREKARAAVLSLPENSTVLAADTAGICNNKPLVKPANEEEARRMLEAMSGNRHVVSTGVSVCRGEHMETCVVSSEVFFRRITADEINRYWASGEPQDKAGSYAIQGLGAVFVEKLSGSYSGVVGLPLCETAALLQQFGIDCWQEQQPFDRRTEQQ
ncbi:MAG TPA: Maf family protein [Pseudomonadales bacterium]|nr:Maf family protein [Pseudomonadales bacterium]